MSSHWCYRCNKFVRVWRQDITICPECDSGFVEEVNANSSTTVFIDNRRRRFPAAAMYMIGGNHHHHHHHHHTLPNFNENGDDDENSPQEGHRRLQHCPMMTNTAGGDRSPFNPVIMLRGNGSGVGSGEGSYEGTSSRRRGFELFYDDGDSAGLRPLPPSMSEFILGTGFDRVLEQLSQIERHEIENNNHHQNPPPASKSTVETLPMVEIGETHLATEPHCAVCKEPFELGTTVKEMPCKHIYHSECILPWLAMRNSCPVCRHELPPDEDHVRQSVNVRASAEENMGLTIWRLPGGGYAVGRFSGGRRSETEREVQVQVPSVYTEMDGGDGFGNGNNHNNNVGEATRRVSWTVESSSRARRSVGGGLRRLVNNLFGCFTSSDGGGRGFFRHRRTNSSSTRESIRPLRGASVVRSSLNSDYSSSARSRNRTWSMDVQNGMRHW